MIGIIDYKPILIRVSEAGKGFCHDTKRLNLVCNHTNVVVLLHHQQQKMIKVG